MQGSEREVRECGNRIDGNPSDSGFSDCVEFNHRQVSAEGLIHKDSKTKMHLIVTKLFCGGDSWELIAS